MRLIFTVAPIILALLLSWGILAISYPTVLHLGCLFYGDSNSLCTATGQIDAKHPAPSPPYYYSNGTWVRASLLEVAGVEYYVLDATGLEPGMQVELQHVQNGNVVLRWNVGTAHEIPNTPVCQNSLSGKQPDTTEEKETASAMPVPFRVLAAFLFLLVVSRNLFAPNIRQYVSSHDQCKRGMVRPRLLGFLSIGVLCALLLDLAVYFCIHRQYGDAVFFGVICLCPIYLAANRLCVSVTYDRDFLTLNKWGKKRTYPLSSICSATWETCIPCDTYCLKLVLEQGEVLKFEQFYFLGTSALYQSVTPLKPE